jgi:hypothetical protein
MRSDPTSRAVARRPGRRAARPCGGGDARDGDDPYAAATLALTAALLSGAAAQRPPGGLAIWGTTHSLGLFEAVGGYAPQ